MKNQFNYKNWEFLDLLYSNENKQAKVWLCRKKTRHSSLLVEYDEKLYAAKLYVAGPSKIIRKNCVKDAKYEYNFMKSFNDSRIAKCYDWGYGVLEGKNTDFLEGPYVIQEFYPGKLSEYLNAYIGKPHDEKIVKYIAYEYLEGLDYLHSQGYFHGDSKLENIMLDLEGNIVNIDFAGSIPLSGKYGSGIGDLNFTTTKMCCAYEVYKNQKDSLFGRAIDAFSAGMTIFEMFYVNLSYFGGYPNDTNEFYKKFMQGDYDVFWEEVKKRYKLEFDSFNKGREENVPKINPSDYIIDNKDVRNLIEGLIDPNPYTRLTIREALNHTLFQSLTEKNKIDCKQILKNYSIESKIDCINKINKDFSKRCFLKDLNFIPL